MAKKKTSPEKVKKTRKAKKKTHGKSKGSSRKRSASKTKKWVRPKDRLKDENEKLRDEIKALRSKIVKQSKEISSLQGKMETRVKREEAIMKTLKISTRSTKNASGAAPVPPAIIYLAESFTKSLNEFP